MVRDAKLRCPVEETIAYQSNMMEIAGKNHLAAASQSGHLSTALIDSGIRLLLSCVAIQNCSSGRRCFTLSGSTNQIFLILLQELTVVSCVKVSPS